MNNKKLQLRSFNSAKNLKFSIQTVSPSQLFAICLDRINNTNNKNNMEVHTLNRIVVNWKVRHYREIRVKSEVIRRDPGDTDIFPYEKSKIKH